MSWRDAPVYVEAHDLAAWLLERFDAIEACMGRRLGEEIAAASADLLVSVSLALTFPATRSEHLERADHGIVRLRTLLRLAEAIHALSPRRLRYCEERLAVVGRMVGGWRKRLRDRPFERYGVGERDGAPFPLDGTHDENTGRCEAPPVPDIATVPAVATSSKPGFSGIRRASRQLGGNEGTGHPRREACDPGRELRQRGQERPLREPQQQEPEEQEQERRLPRRAPRRPEPAARKKREGPEQARPRRRPP